MTGLATGMAAVGLESSHALRLFNRGLRRCQSRSYVCGECCHLAAVNGGSLNIRRRSNLQRSTQSSYYFWLLATINLACVHVSRVLSKCSRSWAPVCFVRVTSPLPDMIAVDIATISGLGGAKGSNRSAASGIMPERVRRSCRQFSWERNGGRYSSRACGDVGWNSQSRFRCLLWRFG